MRVRGAGNIYGPCFMAHMNSRIAQDPSYVNDPSKLKIQVGSACFACSSFVCLRVSANIDEVCERIVVTWGTLCLYAFTLPTYYACVRVCPE